MQHNLSLCELKDLLTEDQHERWKAARKALDEGKLQEGEKHGTVGAVAIDSQGHLAAATSTGGIFNGCVAKKEADLLEWREKAKEVSFMRIQSQNPFKWRHFQSEIISLCVRWYVRYSLSYRDHENGSIEGKI
ncbi:hypothetical protein KSD_79100 [Ktedonobacter sp. SOSP1-85]|nr:hypothetical protein KSD_79100 [Ktedonobacter sp. SOSP1-85]